MKRRTPKGYATTFGVIDALLRRGATHIEVDGIKADFPPAPAAPGQVATFRVGDKLPEAPVLVDAGGGVMVDPDLLGHEVGA